MTPSRRIRVLGLLAVGVLLLAAGCMAPGARTDTELQWREGARPVYPPQARAEGVEGRVVVEYRVTVEGTVADVRVVESEPSGVFDEAALAAVRTWRYQPFRKEGEPVPVPGVRSTLRFRLGEAYQEY